MNWTAFRKGLQFVHLWAGLFLSIPFVLIGLSGALIIVMNVVRDYSPPSAPARGDIKPIASIVAVAEEVAPDGWPLTMVAMPSSIGEPAIVQANLPPGQRAEPRPALQGINIFVDPVSLEILGTAERRRAGEFMRQLVNMHVALMAPRYYGLQTVGFLGIGLVLFGISGLVLWWPRKGGWRHAFGIRRGATGFRLNHDLHASIGFWSLVVFLPVCVSGVMLSFPVSFQDAVGYVLPLDNRLTKGILDPEAAASVADPKALTPDEAARIALAAVPNARVREVHLPPSPDGAHMVTLVPRPFDDGAPLISTFIGPGPEIYDVVDPRNTSSGKQLQQWLRVLHYGQGLGEGWRFLVFLSGLLPLLFAITGFRMWQIKRAQRRRPLPDALPQPAE